MIIVTMTHITNLEQREPYIEGHKQFIAKCMADGVLIAAGPTEGKAGGVLLMNIAASQVVDLMRKDPYIQHKISSYAVTSFKVGACHQKYHQLKELEA